MIQSKEPIIILCATLKSLSFMASKYVVREKMEEESCSLILQFNRTVTILNLLQHSLLNHAGCDEDNLSSMTCGLRLCEVSPCIMPERTSERWIPDRDRYITQITHHTQQQSPHFHPGVEIASCSFSTLLLEVFDLEGEYC